MGKFVDIVGVGTQKKDLDMGTHKVTNLAAPTTAGDAIRETAIITEAALETAITGGGGGGADFLVVQVFS